METITTPSLDGVCAEMQRHGMKLPAPKVRIHIADAQAKMEQALRFFLKAEAREPVWLPEYDEVCQWLQDNRGRGLFLYGNCGRGKTLLGRYVLPALLLQHYQKVVTVYEAQEMNMKLDEVLLRHIVSIDDIGTEGLCNTYGNKRMAFAEVMDAAEKQGKLVIATTNLGVREIRAQYGDRVLERIVATTRRILFEGESLRY
ncbi:DNA replication protein DnaC [Dysgonomonas sp. PH5-45]|uniref:nSTAND3 domain-containing NTPase n=1 Tax=unclassified Dysgonomonas TaxID=2630389 RepID=UPI0024768B32|nr:MULTISPECIES: hypothetical protein [unclassified Dysgonomonas]MDH6354510.1 DNA replication protein DnaC [Dysgonomonas sp. PH5-45]MDH6387433.1 DNA replication protein DnaC [Dysgonomonas sp. PH5-37]